MWCCAGAVAVAVFGTGCTDEDLKSILDEPRYVNLRVELYCPQPGFEPVSLFVLNHSLFFAADGSFELDFDRDGLSDKFEDVEDYAKRYQIDPGNEDTLEDGYGDLLVASLGMEVDDQKELSKCESVYQDSDRDDLDDCEEALVGTDEYDPDTDKDGIPDGIEVRYNLNPLDIEDARLDTDQDGVANASEIRKNTPMGRHNSEDPRFEDRTISYDIVDVMVIDGAECQQIDVMNIPIWDLENGNLIRLVFLEKGFSVDHGTLSEARAATLVVSRFYPESRRISVKEIKNQIQTVGFDEVVSRE
jgi:hypothetical protein